MWKKPRGPTSTMPLHPFLIQMVPFCVNGSCRRVRVHRADLRFCCPLNFFPFFLHRCGCSKSDNIDSERAWAPRMVHVKMWLTKKNIADSLDLKRLYRMATWNGEVFWLMFRGTFCTFLVHSQAHSPSKEIQDTFWCLTQSHALSVYFWFFLEQIFRLVRSRAHFGNPCWYSTSDKIDLERAGSPRIVHVKMLLTKRRRISLDLKRLYRMAIWNGEVFALMFRRTFCAFLVHSWAHSPSKEIQDTFWRLTQSHAFSVHFWFFLEHFFRHLRSRTRFGDWRWCALFDHR